jgi:hypothetical protein
MQKQLIVIIFVTAIIAGGGGFYLGTRKSTTEGSRPAQGQFGERGNFTGAGRGNRTGGGVVNGEIVAKDSGSITVALRGGQGGQGSKIVFLSDSTQIVRSASGSTSDLSIGANVSVFGSTNADGSLVAQNVSIRPEQSERGVMPTSTER